MQGNIQWAVDVEHDAAIRREAYEQGAREERERVLNKAWIRIETVAPEEGVHCGWVLLSEVKAAIESLRTPTTQDTHIEQFPESP